VQRSAKGWDWKTVGFSVFAAEIKRSYKRARQAMLKARNRNRSEAFHSWRKRVKTLWYALRLLEERVQPLRRQLTDLGRLEEWLGEDHNLLVLHTQLGRSPSVAGAARLKVFVERRQHALHRKALALGARQFRDAPAEFARHLQRMWRLRGQHAA
jgi:CHAD domain-containing protein